MAKKLDTTPNGIICSCCGHDKDPYEFFRYINKYDRRFFAAGIPPKSDICFDCAGDYECIKCHVTQPSTEFRIQGRICYTCQNVNPTRRTPTAAQKRADTVGDISFHLESPDSVDMGVYEE